MSDVRDIAERIVSCIVANIPPHIRTEISDHIESALLAERRRAIEPIELAIAEYRRALANREHGGVAQDKAFKAIEASLASPREETAPESDNG